MRAKEGVFSENIGQREAVFMDEIRDVNLQ